MDGGRYMTKQKYDEFYFKGDKNYSSEVYWELYNKDKIKAIEKYDGNIFCPICKKAPLTIVNGNKRKYFKVSSSDMDKHEIDCSYRHIQANSREIELFYKDLDNSKIRSRLVSCMNLMLKKIKLGECVDNSEKEKNKHFMGNEFLTIKTKEGKYKRLPEKNILQKFKEEDFGIQKIFYGKCMIEKKIINTKSESRFCKLKLINENRKAICNIDISNVAFSYMENKIEELKNDGEYYICFSSCISQNYFVIDSRQIPYKECKIYDSRLIIIESV